MNRNVQTRLIHTAFWLAPALMLTSDLLTLLDSPRLYWAASITFWLSFYAFLFVIYGMLQLLKHSTYATIAAMIATFGALIGITIIGMSRLAWGVAAEGISREVIAAADAQPWVFFTSRFPGITFPLGLIMLVVALKRNKLISGYLLAGLLFSILLFPLGRIPKEVLINVIGDGLMLICFGLVGTIYRNHMPRLAGSLPA